MGYIFNMNLKLLSEASNNFIPVYLLKTGDEFFIRDSGVYGKLIRVEDIPSPFDKRSLSWYVIVYDAFLPNGIPIHQLRPIHVTVGKKELRKIRD
jgi:hypothetical protein